MEMQKPDDTGSERTGRLSASDWIAHGMSELSMRGHGALRADTMARTLGVSRGSFYWHFADVRAYHLAIIAAWRREATEGVIERLATDSPAETRLLALLSRAFDADTTLERRMRAWAVEDAEAASAIAETDLMRRAYLAELIAAAGLAPDVAKTRADLIYCAYLGTVMENGPRLPATVASRITALRAFALGAT